jgi:PAS domain S-box-containing protein
VLLVEDCREDAELVIHTLRRSGQEVTWRQVESASELGARLRTGSWDVVIADFSLPQFSAMSALVMVRERELDLPFIVISGVVGEETAVEAMRAGAHDFVTKSNLVRLPAVVEREVRGARERRAWREATESLSLQRSAMEVPPVAPSPWEWFLPLGLATSLTLIVTLCAELLQLRFLPTLAPWKASILVLGVSGPLAAISLYFLVSRRRELMQRVVAQFVEQRRLNEMRRRLAERTRELETKMAERQRRERHLQAQHAITRIMAGSRPLEEALPALLEAFCRELGWDTGEFWGVAPGSGIVGSVACHPAAALHVRSREQMCGRVREARVPCWLADLQGGEGSLLPAGVVEEPRARAALGFPVRLGAEILGVMVFTASQPRPVDAELLELLEDIGSQIGQFVERRRAEAGLQKAHEELESRVRRRTAELASLNEALSRSEANLRQAQQIARLGSFEAYTPFHLSRGSYWSEEGCRILGLDPLTADLSVEAFISRWVHPEDQPRLRRVLLEGESLRESTEFEHRVLRPDGATRFVRTRVEPCLDEAGRLLKVVGTLHDITERKQLEKQVLEASENEQRRIGQDLHDDLCQHLAGIEFMSQALSQRLQEDGNPEAGLALQVAGLVRGAINQTRGLARGLSPVQLESRGLLAALLDLADHVQGLFSVECRLEADARVEVRNPAVATHLYRIAQEAIHNAVRHGKAARIEIALHLDGPLARFRIEDNGTGFAPRPDEARSGMGLRIMQYRADMIGASLQVIPRTSGGVLVECTFGIESLNP